MMEVVDKVMEFAEEFNDKGSESLGSFYDKAIDQLFNVSEKEQDVCSNWRLYEYI